MTLCVICALDKTNQHRDCRLESTTKGIKRVALAIKLLKDAIKMPDANLAKVKKTRPPLAMCFMEAIVLVMTQFKMQFKGLRHKIKKVV